MAQPLLDVSGHGERAAAAASLPNVSERAATGLHSVYVRTGTGDFYDDVDFDISRVGQWSRSGQRSRLLGTAVLGTRLINTDYNNFAPRFGIAYSPSDKWSFRTGFGIFYSQESKNSIFDLNRGLGGRAVAIPDQRLNSTVTYTNFINASVSCR